MSRIFTMHATRIRLSITDDCINCGRCVDVCPIGVLAGKGKGLPGKPSVFDETVCICCGHCIAVCPKDAIVHSELPRENFTEIPGEGAIEWGLFVDFTRRRRSTRHFSATRVSAELIEKILDESVRYAPSGHNRQMTRIIIVEGGTLEQLRDEMNRTIIRLCRYLETLRHFSSKLEIKWRNMRSFKNMIDEGMDPSTRNAPLAMAFCADKRIKESEVDASVASYQALLSAEILGLRTCYFGALVNTLPYSKKLKRLLRLQANDAVCCGLLMGYSNTTYRKLVFRKRIDRIHMK
ncbi:MAG: nitroreductase family protein [Spirochaetes bacterium]|nr:nitroreductase family protein [Spirochaetota bacterium]